VNAVLVLDGDGNRLAGKYYGDFLSGKNAQEVRQNFEKQLHQKIHGIAAKSDAAEVVTCAGGHAAVFCGGGGNGDVRIVHVGPPGESELLLAHLAEGMYDALAHLMGGATDRTMVLDNLELVFLLIDEHCDGGIILETDGNKLAASVLLRDESEGMMEQEQAMMQGANVAATQGMPAGVSAGDMTIGQAFRQAREQFMAGMSN